ncbi:hypothetical protein SAMN04515671_3957 [Nakamurella panacisegetis]|uniref:YD repeat-containing protein n=1 Tax=Nakamurella panacisegetis TaxID=1090615 RepID=A0A1H0S8L8_9ACTN|nr:hypothetical protein [Nakamurella panacisegetis]SDP37995.1 hypothetical protein SAMN04515671_3957 [Nakamurella panacisegetis]
MTTRGRRVRSGLGALGLAATLTLGLLEPAQASSPATVTAPLTNLSHLNFLTDRVTVKDTADHSTYHLSTEPQIGVVWVYADPRPGNTFERVGGGAYDSATNHWGQGAYDGDDISRAAVVYLRQWRATGDQASREQAYQQLRGLAYLQTLTGAHAGDSVLWMQPDGELNPSPTPTDTPNPSDSGPSYWLARSLWAFGEGYAAFAHSDPEFAAFLRSRMDLAIGALNRDVLSKYGQYQVIHGVKVPAWLIVDGADASSEAMLGLAAYARATPPGTSGDTARSALRKLGVGVAKMSAGTTTSWPYRALLPWALSRSDWHAWGAQMPAGLAAASVTLHDRSLLQPAIADAAGFTPHLLTSTGAVNGLLPTPTDGTTIAYGADARVESLLAVATASDRPGLRTLAGIAAGWFFGQNAAGTAVYDPATGVTNDGVSATGTVNQGSGAESTIHGLLTMQLLDANPDIAAVARSSASIRSRDGQRVVEAESGKLTGNASVVVPASTWTGESAWSGSYLTVGSGSTATWQLPAATGERRIEPVAELTPGSTAVSTFTAGRQMLGQVRYGATGAQGNAPSPTELTPVDLRSPVPAAATTVTARTRGGSGNLDALLVTPVVSTLSLTGDGHRTVLLNSVSRSRELVAVGGPRDRLTVNSYDRNGALVQTRTGSTALVLPGGFTIARN